MDETHGPSGPLLHRHGIAAKLVEAGRFVEVGKEVPDFRRYGIVRRTLARLTGKIVLFFLQIVTIHQRSFNLHALESLRALAMGLQDLEAELSRLRTSISRQERRLELLLVEARKRLPEPFDADQLRRMAREERQLLDSRFEVEYLRFEDRFRGTREEIKKRLHVYLPVLRLANAGAPERPVLDLGCGRGEWMELLGDHGLVVRGVEQNNLLVAECRERGFELTHGDAVEYLRGLSDASVGAVTAFHVVEHLTHDELVALLDETVRVLKPGGIAIFETPNPRNLLVGSCDFYLDPTHRRPLPDELLRFLMETRGLGQVKIEPLHPSPERFPVDGGKLAERLNEHFYGARDYGAIGYKT